ncbi:hypothetical protein BV20DRAFT_207727 [Pilatotrama ljubarskyi]|nr:hypothetical protein BV20DRAFT_207727 [Pilatotrama ljubarskyi]
MICQRAAHHSSNCSRGWNTRRTFTVSEEPLPERRSPRRAKSTPGPDLREIHHINANPKFSSALCFSPLGAVSGRSLGRTFGSRSRSTTPVSLIPPSSAERVPCRPQHQPVINPSPDLWRQRPARWGRRRYGDYHREGLASYVWGERGVLYLNWRTAHFSVFRCSSRSMTTALHRTS